MTRHRPPRPLDALPCLSRRDFLIGAAAGGFALVFGRAACASQDPSAAIAARDFEASIWFHIDATGIVTVNVARAEMGQHVGTALARIVAEELEADWSMMRVVHVDSDPRWGEMVTGGSVSVFEGFAPLSRAGAAARIALVQEASRLLGVPADACVARAGRVEAGGRSLGYGDIVRRGNLTRRFTAQELEQVPLKAPARRHIVGRALPAVDIPAKVDGRARYGIDAQVDGMAYACPKVPPTRNGSQVLAVDDAAARGIRGYLRSLVLHDPSGTVPGWVMVLGESFVAASRAAEAVQVQWRSDDTARVSEQDILDHGARLIDAPSGGVRIVDDPGVEEALARAPHRLECSYTTASALHFQLEPVNALAYEKDGLWQIHSGTQWQSLTVPLLAKALGVPPERIVLRSQLLGGGFGRRLNGDYTVPAALASQALGRPVKMICTRADDSRFDSFRSPSVQKIRLGWDAQGRMLAMEHHAAAGWPNLVMAPDSGMAKTAAGESYDPDAIGGADHWYSVGAHRVRVLSNDLANRAFRPGWLRSVGSGWTHWALESALDEAAAALGSDPLALRLRLLDGQGRNAGEAPAAVGGASRLAQVLRRAAAKAGWGASLPPDTGLGIAASSGQSRDMPTWVVCVARVHVDRREGRVRLERLTLVVDAGTIVDPGGALAQVEGGCLWGASLALHEGTEFKLGQVQDSNLDTYTPMRMRDVPPLDIEFLPSTETPVGLGEPATTVVAPAIGNAIFAAVGVRLRHMPMRAQALLQALAAKGAAA